ncbi:MAG: phosphoadenylyl-sulfate reductase, partial [Planctomycetota bacterium]
MTRLEMKPVVTTEEQLRPTSDLLDELAAESERLESATPEEIIQWSVDRFGDRLTMGTAFGPEGMTILARLSKIGPNIKVFNLDTGYQFQETLDLRDEV